MSFQRDHVGMFLRGIIVLLVPHCINHMVSLVVAEFVIINHSGRDLEADCGVVSWTIPAGERAAVAVAIDINRALDEVGPLDLLKLVRPHRHEHHRQTCRIEAGNCFLSWDPLNIDHVSMSSESSSTAGDYEWEVNERGVALLQSSSTSSRRSSMEGTVYKMLWQPSNQLLSASTQCMCAPPSSPLAQAFYSVLLYFRE